MNTPQDIAQFEAHLRLLVPDLDTRGMILQFTREEWRRGYLHGKREMKMAAENAIANLKVQEI